MGSTETKHYLIDLIEKINAQIWRQAKAYSTGIQKVSPGGKTKKIPNSAQNLVTFEEIGTVTWISHHS